MATPRRRSKPTPRHRPRPVGGSAAAAGAAAGGATFAGGSAAATMVGLAVTTAAAEKIVAGTVKAIAKTLKRIAALRLARSREALQAANYPESAIEAAMRRETQLEAVYQRRAEERLRAALTLASRAPDISARTAAVDSALRREQNYARQRAIASGARVFAEVGREALEKQSPLGAFWKLGIAQNHTPDCLAMAERFWPWEVLRKIRPLLHTGCKCRLYSYGEAIAAGWMKPSDIPSPAAALRMAQPVIEWVHANHRSEDTALAELLLREEMLEVPGVDRNFLAAAPLATDAELIAALEPDEEPAEDPDDPASGD